MLHGTMNTLYFAGAELGFGSGSNPIKRLHHIFHECGIESVLFSYFYVSKEPEYLYQFKDVFLDSGAYSAFTQKKPINIQDYIRFIKEHGKAIKVYSNLDVIGDPQATYFNQKLMEKEGLKPLPCYHHGEDPAWLDRYLSEGHEYIALGGMVPLSKTPQVLIRWLRKTFDRIPDHVRIHGFGISNPNIIKLFPFHSVDSTSWMMGQKYNALYFFKRGQLTNYPIDVLRKRFKKDFAAMHYMDRNRHNIKQWKLYADYRRDKR